MGLFDFFRKGLDGSDANRDDLGVELISNKKRLEEINNSIEILKQESKDVFAEYLASTKALEKENKKLNTRTKSGKQAKANNDKQLKKAQSKLNSELKKKQQEIKKLYNEKIDTINDELDNNKNELEILIKNIDDEKFRLNFDSENEINRIKDDINGANQTLAELQKELETKQNQYFKDIKKLSTSADKKIKEKQDELQKEFEETQTSLKSKRNSIDKKIAEKESGIVEAEGKIKNINSEFESYSEIAEQNKKDIIDVNDKFLSNNERTISDISKKINAIKDVLNDRLGSYNREVENVNNKKLEAQNVYEQNIANINGEYESLEAEENSKYNQKALIAKQEHENILAQIKAEYDQQVLQIKQSYDDKKNEYKEAKKASSKELSTIKKETSQEIGILNKQHDELAKSVDELRKQIASQEEKYNNEVSSINNDLNNKLSLMSDEYSKSVEQIINEYETIPQKQLEDITNQLEAKQREYNDRYNEIFNEKKRISDEETVLVNNYKELIEKANAEIEARKLEYKQLKQEASKGTEEYDAIIAQRKKELETFSSDIKVLAKQHEEQREKDYKNLKADLESKFKALKEHNKTEEELTASNYKTQVNNYLSEIKEKEAKVNEKINKLIFKRDVEKNKRNDWFEKTANDYNERIENLKSNLELLSEEKVQKLQAYDEDINKLEKNNSKLLAEKKKSLDKLVNEVTAKAIEQSNETANNIAEINNQIKDIEIKGANDIEEYQTFEKLKFDGNNEIKAKQDEFLEKANKEKEELDIKINEVKQLIEKNKEAYNAAVSELQLKQSATKSKLEQLTSDIDYEYDQKIVEANEKYENLMKQAQLKHDENLADIEENRKNQENEINAEFEGRRNELRYIKSTYRDAIKEKQNDVERKIGELKVQQKELENNIATITKNMADEKDSFNKAIDELSKDYEEQAAILTKEYEDKVTEINEQYVSRPSEDLKIAIERLNAKKQEYADEIARINSKKDETARISDQVIERYNKLRHEVDQSLNEKNSEYKKLYDECAQREYELNSDLIKKENELKEYQEEINVQIAGIREAKKQEIDNYVKKLDEKYEAEQAHYKEIQDAAAKRVENEILSLKSHLDTKKANIDSLLAEINNRKQAIEDENSNKYNMVLDETRKLQQEFDELVSANGLKISEYSKNLALKKEEYKNALDNIKESNRRAIEEKLQMVENFNSENREKISKIREEIIALGEQKNIESAKLEDYTNQKNASMEAIKKDTEDYIELIKNMIEGIADKFVDLEKQHKERVVRIKAEIAKTVSEYDDLIRLKPQLIDDANKEEVNLLDKTEEFKEKINKLESIHNEILKELENKREYAIQMINEEIDKLENEKPNKIKRYKDEISDISLAYEAMLKDEKAKQAKLKEDIESANLKTAQIEKNNEEELDKYEELFNKDKEELSQEYENDLKQTTGEYISKNKELTSELEKLVGSKESLALELTNLSKQFGIVDEDISNSVLALKKECNDKMEEIKQLYQNKLESNREELKLIDVMND